MGDPGRAVLRVEDLVSEIADARGAFRVADGVTFEVRPGRITALVGESGCGKTSVALAVLRLLPPPARVVGGRILYRGSDLLAAPEAEMRQVRGRGIAMMFQEPATSLNPVVRVGPQVAEALRAHAGVGRGDAAARAVELLAAAGLPEPERCARAFPHQLSSGMRQRATFAMALSCDPDVLIADEPTAAMDPTLQAELLGALRRSCRERGRSVLLITHDLGVVARWADDVLVMYAGRIVEHASAAALLANPRHHYTVGLIGSVPSLLERRRLIEMPGAAPSLSALPAGCKFRDRCAEARDPCGEGEPGLVGIADGHEVRCLFPQGTPP